MRRAPRRPGGVTGAPRLAAVTLVALVVVAAGFAWGQAQKQAAPLTGKSLMSPALQAMQRDDTTNPGFLWVQEGLERWSRPDGARQVACASCHGAAPAPGLRGVAPRYPAWDTRRQRVLTLSQRIEQCRVDHQQAAAQAPEGPVRLALEAAVAQASRGLPMAPPEDPRLQGARDLGARLWGERAGQLHLACAHCHEDRVGQLLGGRPIPPASAVGYPTYRLEWQSLGSLQRRLRNCQTGVRAEPYAPDSAEATALETYLAWRDRSLPLEAPAVRP